MSENGAAGRWRGKRRDRERKLKNNKAGLHERRRKEQRKTV